MPDDRLIEQLRALGDPVRYRILELLPDTCDCEKVYNVSELTEDIGLAQPTVSHHLKVLKHAGLVRCTKMCRDVYYWVDRDAVRGVAGALTGVADRPGAGGPGPPPGPCPPCPSTPDLPNPESEASA